MTRATKPKNMGPAPVPPTVKEWADLDMPTESWQPENDSFWARLNIFKNFLTAWEKPAWPILAVKYVLGYTTIATVGTHISILMFKGVEMWSQLNLLATFAPIAISLPIAAHGVSIRFKAIQLNEKYKHLLDHDDLTGLNSRRYMFKQLEKQSGRFNYLFMIDMDQLKRINDQMGHLAGDTALIRIAGALSATSETEDVIGRLSGDEFMVLTTIDNADDVLTMAQRTLQKLQEKNEDYTKAQAITVSMGIAKISHGTSICKTVHEADKALYSAKQRGGNRFQFATLPEDVTPPPHTSAP